MIKIEGYVIESYGKEGFKIKITKDDVEDEKGKHPNVSKEKDIYINPSHHPHDERSFVRVGNGGDNRRYYIDECMSVSAVLKKGDRVECSVYIVDDNITENTNSYAINS